MIFIDKDLASIQESRILLEHAKEAKGELKWTSQDKLDEIVTAVYKAVSVHLEELVKLAVEETGYGCQEDEYMHAHQLLRGLMDQISTMKCVGILNENQSEKTKDIGVPFGIIAVLCPSISPVAAVISSALLCLKSGNVVVFIPNVRAVATVRKTVFLMKEAAIVVGLKKGAMSCLETVSDAGIKAVIRHENVSAIVNIGVKEFLPDCVAAKGPLFYGSTGPSPVFIEKTANIERAVEDIINSRSFNHGIMSGAEQYVVVDNQIATEVKAVMSAGGAFFMDEEQEKRLLLFLCPKGNEVDLEYIGRSAAWLAKQAGFTVPKGTKVLVSEKRYIADRNPYSKEFQCPIMAYYIETDWMRACERCMSLLVEESKGHSLVIHSEDEEIIMEFALKKPVARILVNTPAVGGAMGITTKLFPSVILGGLTTGIGATAENISPMHLTYIRKMGYDVRKTPESKSDESTEEMLHRFIKKALSELNNQ